MPKRDENLVTFVEAHPHLFHFLPRQGGGDKVNGFSGETLTSPP